MRGPVTQAWTHDLSLMQQTVLLTAIRGPDGLPKYAGVKMLLRWYRRCVLLSAMDGRVLSVPYEPNGGSFTGPSFMFNQDDDSSDVEWERRMDDIVSDYVKTLDAVPHHFHLHLMHASEILGYKHPDTRIRAWWNGVYKRFVNDMHVHPESEEELDSRLGDTREGWLKRADPATRS